MIADATKFILRIYLKFTQTIMVGQNKEIIFDLEQSKIQDKLRKMALLLENQANAGFIGGFFAAKD